VPGRPKHSGSKYSEADFGKKQSLAKRLAGIIATDADSHLG
jgi:hypothetical protein